MGLRVAVALVSFVLLMTGAGGPVVAGSGDRTLWLYHTHTHETGRFTFMRNGQYDQSVLKQMNVFLADWRTKDVTRMDPHLFDLLWEVYQEVGGTRPYNIVSSYRSPKTNAMLRSSTAGVAEKSQHMLGHAMDVFIPGVSLSKLRATAMKHQVGGVGFYPTSGSPFVHMDVGSVRAWPRMTRAQLKVVFPDGKTIHLPVDGKPLSAAGRLYAQAQWKQCHMVPCNGGGLVSPLSDGSEIRVASLDPAQRSVPTINIVAPQPMSRPGLAPAADLPGTTQLAAVDTSMIGVPDAAPVPMQQPVAPLVPSVAPLMPPLAIPDTGKDTALSALAAIDPPVPAARILQTPPDDEVLTAYAPEIAPEPGAQRALQLLLNRAPNPMTPPPAPAAKAAPVSARAVPPGATSGLHIGNSMFDLTWSAVSQNDDQGAMQAALAALAASRNPIPGLRARAAELVAPETDHVNETLMTPAFMSSDHYAALYEPEGYLDNSAELGALATRVGLEPDLNAPPRYDIFVSRAPLLLASR